MAEEKKKKVNYSGAWAEAKVLIWNYRWRLVFGSVLMLISRAAGTVLPASTKFIVDDVFGQRNYGLLKWIALAVGISTLVQAATSFTLSQVLGVAAQRAKTRSNPYRKSADFVFRFDANRTAYFADYERRGRHPQSGWHRSRANRQRNFVGSDFARGFVLFELAHHFDNADGADYFRRGFELCFRQTATALS